MLQAFGKQKQTSSNRLAQNWLFITPQTTWNKSSHLLFVTMTNSDTAAAAT
jgi:hypothetical protein